MSDLEKLLEFCHEIGSNPMYVQGAGGNISLKSGDRLLVKASGKKLGDAHSKNFLVDVDLAGLKKSLSQGDFEVTPSYSENGGHRPSIETTLHALMPHRYVLHLHHVDCVSVLIQKGARDRVDEILKGVEFSYRFVSYRKPGPRLSKALDAVISSENAPEVVFLQNHGVVLGAETIQSLRELLTEIDTLFASSPSVSAKESCERIFEECPAGYSWLQEPWANSLAIDLLPAVRTNWAICPDHVVFLGDRPTVVADKSELLALEAPSTSQVVFVKDVGVLRHTTVSETQLEQLRFYFDVIARVKDHTLVSCLDTEQIHELLNWDAEKYRQSMSTRKA